VTNELPLPIKVEPYHDWTVDFGSASFGLLQWQPNRCEIYIVRYHPTVPLSAPVVAVAFSVIVLLLLFTGYYLIGNLRHKDAPAAAKLD
jgi:hypothetical protein